MGKLGLIILVSAATIIFAAAPTVAADRTVGEFLESCNSDPITCVMDMKDALYSAEVDEGVACLPDGIDGTAPVDEIDWLQQGVIADPALADRGFLEVAIAGAQTLFPCE
jgi:hypothetical protein